MNWTEVAKEIGRLISDDRYLNKKEWWNYPEWLAEQEVKRARVAEQVENREVMSTDQPKKSLKNRKCRKMWSMNIILAIRCISVLLSMKFYLLMTRE